MSGKESYILFVSSHGLGLCRFKRDYFFEEIPSLGLEDMNIAVESIKFHDIHFLGETLLCCVFLRLYAKDDIKRFYSKVCSTHGSYIKFIVLCSLCN